MLRAAKTLRLGRAEQLVPSAVPQDQLAQAAIVGVDAGLRQDREKARLALNASVASILERRRNDGDARAGILRAEPGNVLSSRPRLPPASPRQG